MRRESMERFFASLRMTATTSVFPALLRLIGNSIMHFLKLDRQAVTKSTLREHEDDNFVPGTIEQRVLMVWPITREIAALNPDYDVERRLQRHVVCVARRAR